MEAHKKSIIHKRQCHVPIPQRHRSEDEHRQNRMEPVHKPHPVLGKVRHGRRGRVVEEEHAGARGEAVVHLAIMSSEAVGEAGEGGRGGEDGEQDLGHEAGDEVARAVVGEDGGEELEGEKRAGGEELGKVGGVGEGFAIEARRTRWKWNWWFPIIIVYWILLILGINNQW